MGTDLGVVKLHIVRSVKRKTSANCLRIPAKLFLTYRASEGALFWYNIEISCLLLSLQIVFEAFHLLCAQNEPTVGH